MLERYLQLQPAIYATLVSKDMNTARDSDISTLNENDTGLAEEIMECLVPLRDMIIAICTEKTPTVSIIIPLIKKIGQIMSPKETNSTMTRSIMEAVTGNLTTRYTSEEIRNYLEECTLLNPRFKDQYFEQDELNSIYNRLSLLLCSEEHVPVKVEGQAVQTLPQLEKPPPLPQLSDDSESERNTDPGMPVPPKKEDCPPFSMIFLLSKKKREKKLSLRELILKLAHIEQHRKFVLTVIHLLGGKTTRSSFLCWLLCSLRADLQHSRGHSDSPEG